MQSLSLDVKDEKVGAALQAGVQLSDPMHCGSIPGHVSTSGLAEVISQERPLVDLHRVRNDKPSKWIGKRYGADRPPPAPQPYFVAAQLCLPCSDPNQIPEPVSTPHMHNFTWLLIQQT